MKKNWIIVVLVLITALLLAVPGSARAVKEPFAEKSAYCEVLDPGTERLVAEKIWQIRGRVYNKRTVPLLSPPYSGMPGTEGWVITTVNIDLNLQTGTGVAWGTWIKIPDNIEGAFEGTFAGAFTAGVWSGRVVGVGSGAYEGYLVKGFQQDIPDPAALPEGGDPCPGGAIPANPGGILTGYLINTNAD